MPREPGINSWGVHQALCAQGPAQSLTHGHLGRDLLCSNQPLPSQGWAGHAVIWGAHCLKRRYMLGSLLAINSGAKASFHST